MRYATSLSPVDRMFRAFSDPTRLRILHMLRDGELCVCDIVMVLAVLQPKASRHLAYLRWAGLIVARRAGRWSYYRLAKAANPFHRKLLECLGCCFEDVPIFQADNARLKKLPRVGSGCCNTKPKGEHT